MLYEDLFKWWMRHSRGKDSRGLHAGQLIFKRAWSVGPVNLPPQVCMKGRHATSALMFWLLVRKWDSLYIIQSVVKHFKTVAKLPLHIPEKVGGKKRPPWCQNFGELVGHETENITMTGSGKGPWPWRKARKYSTANMVWNFQTYSRPHLQGIILVLRMWLGDQVNRKIKTICFSLQY